MTKHLERDMVHLGNKLSELGSLVVRVIDKSVVMIQTFDPALAEEIIAAGVRINHMEVDIEEDCLKVLALHQPVAIDLRFLIVTLKVNNDLERMGDQAENIAERVDDLIHKERVTADLDFKKMGDICSKMVRQAVVALREQDAEGARQVMAMDDDLDALHARTFDILEKVMAEHPQMINSAMSCLTISSNLERIGDLATNIAEEIVFMQEGEVVRHQEAQGDLPAAG